MKSFWKVYVLVALVGSAGVYFAAPYARPFMKRFVKEEKQKKPSAGGFRVGGGVSGSSGQPGESSVAPPSDPNAGNFEDTPALLGIYLAAGRRNPNWGVIKSKTNLYSKEGKRLGELPAGVIFNYKTRSSSSKGKMISCSLLHKEKEMGPYLIQHKDVYLFTGQYSRLSKNQRHNMEAYYKVKGDVEARKVELMQQLAVKNPHYIAYKQTYERYMSLIDKSKELSMQSDKATGLMRASLDDQLRQMKNDEAELQTKYDKIHAQYKLWKQQHASELPDSSKDSKLNKYSREMQRLAKLIPGLAY